MMKKLHSIFYFFYLKNKKLNIFNLCILKIYKNIFKLHIYDNEINKYLIIKGYFFLQYYNKMSDLSYKKKYLKYKFKYINLKGGRLLDSKDKVLIKPCSIEDESKVYSSNLLNRKTDLLAKETDLIKKNALKTEIKNINDSREESFRKNTKCNTINLQYTDNNKFYFYLELESKSNIIQGDLFTNLIMYTHINPNNIFIIYSNISKQKDYFSKRLDKDNLYEFDKNNTTHLIYANIKKFITDTIKNKIINRYKRNTSIIFDIFTHGNIFSDKFIAIDGKDKFINFNEFYELFDTAYEKDIDVANKSISNITFIASWCYSSILKNFLRRFLNQPIDIMQLNKTKYINFHFISSLPINNNFLIIGSYLFLNENITDISDFIRIKSKICEFVVKTFGYTVVEAENMVNKFISFQNTINFLQFTKLYNNARKQINTNLLKEPGNCSNFFFDLYMGGNTNARFFLQQIIDTSITNDTFILLKNMDLKLNKINETYINWIKNITYRNKPYDIIYLRDNAIINNIDSNINPNLSTLVFNSLVTFDNTCWIDIIYPGDDKLIKYLNDLFKDSFDSMEFYSNLNYNKLTDKNSLLSDIF